MTVRAAVAVLAAGAVVLLTGACASRGAGPGDQPSSGVVDTFTRSSPAGPPSARSSLRPSARATPGCSTTGNGTGFAFSIASSAMGYASPREAAVQFSRHNQVSAPAVAAAAWTRVKSTDGYALSSTWVAVHVTRLPNHAWIVDSGTVCR